MAEEKHHHLFHHHKDEEKTMTYSETGYNNTGAEYEKEEKQHKNKERLGEMGAVAAGTFALYEKHEAKKDPEHKHRHKIEEEIAGAVAVGAGGYVFHEHHEKKEVKDEKEKVEGKKHHFF